MSGFYDTLFSMSRKKFKGIIFDLDGTLVDTVEDLTDALNETLAFYHLDGVSSEEMKKMIGNGLKRVIVLAFPDSMTSSPDFVDEALERMKDNYSKIWVNKTRPFSGIDELLNYCVKNNIKLGVSSNKVDDATQYIIKTLFPDIHFDAVTGNREGVPHKPNPTQTESIIKTMNLKPEEILYVGDSEVDYATAKNSGLTPLILGYGYGDYENLSKKLKIYDSPEDVIKALKDPTSLK